MFVFSRNEGVSVEFWGYDSFDSNLSEMNLEKNIVSYEKCTEW